MEMSRDDFHLYGICDFVFLDTLPCHVRIFTQMNPTRQKKEEAADSSALSGEQRHIKCKDTFLDILNGGHLRVTGADPPLLLRLADEGPLRLGHGPGTTGILSIRADDGILPELFVFLI